MTTFSSSLVEVHELEEDIGSGWYLHRFGDGKKMVIKLEPVTRLGRSICDSVVVSYEHAVLHLLEGEKWIIKDMKSQHGTYVNDMLVPDGGVALEEWDVISLGRKRPRNGDDFGFMLKYKEDSDESCSKDSIQYNTDNSPLKNGSSRSCSPASSHNVDAESKEVKVRVSSPLPSDNERSSVNIQTVTKAKPTSVTSDKPESRSGSESSLSVIEISDNERSNDSERTLKIPPSSKMSADLIPVMQQTLPSISEKIGDWLARDGKESLVPMEHYKEEKSAEKRKRISKYVCSSSSEDLPSDKKRAESSDQSSSLYKPNDASSTESTPKKRYETRHKYLKGASWIEDDYSFDSMSSTSQRKRTRSSSRDTCDSDNRSELSVRIKVRTSHKIKHKPGKEAKNVGYYKDNTWSPYSSSKTTVKTRLKKCVKR